jgi:hypothetical protein
MTRTEHSRRFDGARVALSVLVTAGLGVAVAAVFARYYPRAKDEGPTAAALGDAFTWIFGACIGLLVGSALAALLVRTGSRFVAGLIAGIAGFWIGVAPYVILTGPSDVNFSDSFGFAVVTFIPGLLFVIAGAAAGAALVHVRSRPTGA